MPLNVCLQVAQNLHLCNSANMSAMNRPNSRSVHAFKVWCKRASRLRDSFRSPLQERLRLRALDCISLGFRGGGLCGKNLSVGWMIYRSESTRVLYNGGKELDFLHGVYQWQQASPSFPIKQSDLKETKQSRQRQSLIPLEPTHIKRYARLSSVI